MPITGIYPHLNSLSPFNTLICYPIASSLTYFHPIITTIAPTSIHPLPVRSRHGLHVAREALNNVRAMSSRSFSSAGKTL